MEAVRLPLPLDALRLVRAFASDRVGLHATAEAWDMEVDRQTWSSDFGGGVEWRFETEEGWRRIYWRPDASGGGENGTVVFWTA